MANKLLPRGIRNNNPMNVIITKDKWQGKVTPSQDNYFETFKSPVYGIRAGAKVLLSYNEQGINTVRRIISRYAPPSENNTTAYINAIAEDLDVSPDDVLDFDDYKTMYTLVKAIITHENGNAYANYYSDEVIREALKLAGVHDTPKPKALASTEGKAAAASAGAGTIVTVAATVQAIQPTIPLLQQLITVAPWIVGVGLLVAAGYFIYKYTRN